MLRDTGIARIMQEEVCIYNISMLRDTAIARLVQEEVCISIFELTAHSQITSLLKVGVYLYIWARSMFILGQDPSSTARRAAIKSKSSRKGI